jgi:hypothetical protein
MAWHNDQVILNFTGLSSADEYHVLLTLLNKDIVTGGNVQQLLDASNNLLVRGMTLPNYTPSRYELALMPGAVAVGGNLTIKFDRVNGYRAVVNEVMIWKQGAIGDSTAPVSSITSPTAGAALRGNLAVVRSSTTDAPVSSGTASIEISTNNGSTWNSSSVLTSDGQGAYVWNLPADGNYTLKSRARDHAGNLETPGVGITVRVDNDPPQAVVNFTAADTPADTGGSISLAWTKSTDDGAGDADVDHYEIYRTVYPGRLYSLVTTRPAGTESYADTPMATGTWYYYKIRSVDTAGNTRDTAESPHVKAINNMTDTQAPEDVTNLAAFAGDQQVLLSWTPSVNSDGDLADQRLYISKDDGVTWGDNPPDFNDGHFTSLGPSVATHSATGLINGQPYKFKITVVDSAVPTPNESAGAVVAASPTNTVRTLSGTLASNDTYLPGIYHVTGTVTINAGVVINVQPGVIFKFNSGTGMVVNGALKVDGTSTSKIIFTSIKDDIGGDTNGDGGATTPASGDWQRVYYHSTATAASCLMDYAEIRYAGQNTNAALILNGITFDVTNCHIHHCAYRGLELQNNTSPKIAGNTIEYCGNDGVYHYYGSYSAAASQAIQNNIIRFNQGHGLYLYRGRNTSGAPDTVSFTGNQINNNTGDGLRVEAYNSYFSWTITGNTITGNAGYGIAWGVTSSPANLAGPIRNNIITGNGKLVRTTANMLPDDSSNTLTTTAPLKVWEIVGDTMVGDRRIDVKMSGADTISTYLVSRSNLVVDAGTRLYVIRGQPGPDGQRCPSDRGNGGPKSGVYELSRRRMERGHQRGWPLHPPEKRLGRHSIHFLSRGNAVHGQPCGRPVCQLCHPIGCHPLHQQYPDHPLQSRDLFQQFRPNGDRM